MKVSSLAEALWATSFVEHVALLLVLVTRRRWSTFRFFTIFIAFNVVRTIVLFITYRFEPPRLYADVYWTATGIDLILQILVVLEILRIVLRPAGIWAEDARKRFRSLALGGALLAIPLSLVIHRRLPHGLGGWVEEGELFSVSLAVVLLVAMASSTTALGLVWRRHVAALAMGWAIWNFTNFFVEGGLSYLGSAWHGFQLDNVRIVAYELAVILWIVMFWIPEPERGTLTPEQQEYLFALQKHAEEHARLLCGNPEK